MQPSAPQATSAPTPYGSARSPLERGLEFTRVGGWTIAWVIVGLVAAGLRLIQLDRFALAPDEAERAYDAWSFYTGHSLAPGESLPTTEPLLLLLQALSFFLFSPTDATARLVPAITGLLILVLLRLLQPVVGRPASLGMAIMIAISPTLVLASRAVDPGMLISASALLVVVGVSRAGVAAASGSSIRRWAVTTGIGLGLMLASGPAAITVLLALIVGAIVARFSLSTPTGAHSAARSSEGSDKATATLPRRPAVGHLPDAISAGLRGLVSGPSGPLLVLVGFAATVIVLFSRLFSDIGALQGILDTVIDWAHLLGTGTSATPTQFFLLAIFLYEALAIAFAIVAIFRGGSQATTSDHVLMLGWPFFAGWFVAALLLFAFSAGRAPEHAVHVAFPLLLFGGVGLGYLIASTSWRSVFRGDDGILLLAFLGIIAGLFGVIILAERWDETTDHGRLILEIAVVAIVVIGGLVYLSTALIQHQRASGYVPQAGKVALVALLVLFGALTFRTTVELSFYNVARGNELLAQSRPTESVSTLVARLGRLSRDVSVDRISVRDPLGRYGLTVALDERVEWPFRWYFREYPDAEVVSTGQAPGAGAEVALAPEETGFAQAGYTVQTTTFLNRVPAAYTTPDLGSIFRGVFDPSEWPDSLDYLIYRQLDDPAPAMTMVVGYSDSISARLFPSSGPFNLFEPTDPGANPGQLNSPRGVAVSPDGETIYVVDSLNARVQLFDENGVFLAAWGGTDGTSTISFALFAPTETAIFGPTGIAVGDDGVVYVADTWNHRVVGLSPDGSVVREIGTPAERGDVGDDPAMVGAQPGRFFGPRGVAVEGDEIYVVDTGNERVQVFGLDGTFRRVFGGFGSAPGQLIEPVGIAVSADGFVYVADSGNGRISVFTTDGTPVTQWTVREWSAAVYDPTTGNRPGFEPNVALGPDGLVYVTSRISSAIITFDRSGNEVGQIARVNDADLVGPVGITFDPEGYLYVSDVDSNAVIRSDQPIASASAGVPGAATPQGSNATPDNTPRQRAVPSGSATPATGSLSVPSGSNLGDAAESGDQSSTSLAPSSAPLPSPPGGATNGS